jgi:hypothetical protein
MTAAPPWPLLGRLDPAGLVDARLQAHHAVQLVVSLAVSFLPAAPDDSHTNLEWLPGHALAGQAIPAGTGFRGALRFDPLMLLLLDSGGTVLDEYRLAGRTLAQAYRWLGEAVGTLGAAAGALTGRKHYSIPDHPVASGTPFQPDDRASRELAGYYEGASLALTELARSRADASAVRCWPHHFDIATLATTGPGRTIGAGLSPGDDSYSEPYYYVTPYPYPTGSLPPLRLGLWHTTAWVGAVLPASTFARAGSAAAQRETIQSFLAEAAGACEALV